jgi:two-component system nitrogen regulation sensor histidine kinase NtrY
MSRSRVRSFQGRIFLAILAAVLVPVALGVAAGALTLKTIGTRSGTLGAWDAVAETGLELLDAVEEAHPGDSAVAAAAAQHREALSESVRLSRLYSFVAERFVQVLPLAALVTGLLLAGMAFLVARGLARGFGRPVAELAGWTERIARGEPLPPDEHGPEIEELRTLRDALRRMSEQLEEGRRRDVENAQMRSWTELARRVAHEIKNLLTPMRLAAVTLTRGGEGAESEAGQVLMEEIGRLDEMARTFSQYGKIPEGPRSRIDLTELLDSVARRHATSAAPIQVEGPSGLWVEGHQNSLERAFRNLLLNAVEAQGDGGGSVIVSLEAREGEVFVSIRDRGPGIPLDLVERIWQPDVTTKSGGTGLGLAIVRQTLRHHGGDVSARNHPEGGAVIDLRLPRAGDPGR